MFSLKEYMNDNESVASVETYYSHEVVPEENMDEEMEDEYDEEDENYYMNEVPYKTKPVEKEVPKVVISTKIPKMNPWSLMVEDEFDENVKKSLAEIIEEEKKKKEMLKKKQQEVEEKKSKFKRTKRFNFTNNKSNNGSILLGIKKQNIKK